MKRPEIKLTETQWEFPEPTITTLTNGLTVWHFPLPGQHIAAFELVLPAPLHTEPAELEGVGTIALAAADESTIAHPDMQELLDLCGAALYGGARLHTSRLGARVSSRRINELLPLFADVLQAPAYADDDIALHIESQDAAYKTRLASPSSASRWAMRMALYGTSQRCGRPLAGSPDTLARITRDDVVAWHRRHFAANGATLVVAGEIDDLDLAPLEAWEGTAERFPIGDGDTLPGSVVIVDIPGAVQASVQVGRRSISRLDPLWPAARLAGHVMAGGFDSRLNIELRERLGYTYGVSGGFAPDLRGSLVQFTTSTRTEVAGDAIRRMLDALHLAEPITDDELADAKAFRIGIAPLANETAADIAEIGRAHV